MEAIPVMKYAFHPEAKSEFHRAIDYYEEGEKTLGQQFAVEVYVTIGRAAANPGMWPAIEDGIRRCLVRRFPLWHDEVANELVILAVMHLNREPYYWAHRN